PTCPRPHASPSRRPSRKSRRCASRGPGARARRARDARIGVGTVPAPGAADPAAAAPEPRGAAPAHPRLPAAHGAAPPGPPPPAPVPPPPAPAAPPAPPDNPLPTLRQLQQAAAREYATHPSYIVRLTRREFFNGKHQPEEVVLFKFRKEPFSVYLKWIGTVNK